MVGLVRSLFLFSSILMGIKDIISTEEHIMVNPTFVASFQENNQTIVLYRKHDESFSLDVKKDPWLPVKQPNMEKLLPDLVIKNSRTGSIYQSRLVETVEKYINRYGDRDIMDENSFCLLGVYDAAEFIPEGNSSIITVTDSVLCYYKERKKKDNSTELKAFSKGIATCSYFKDRPDSYHIESITGYAEKISKRAFNINIFVIDEAAHVQSWSLKIQDDELTELSCGLKQFTIGHVDLHSYDPKSKNHSTQLDSGLLSAWSQHFKLSFIESITIYENNVLYSRGLYLNNESIIHSMNHTDWLPRNLFTLKQNEGPTIQAMEIFQMGGYSYVHLGGIEFVNKEDKTPNSRTFYYYCKVKNNASLANNPFPKELDSQDAVCIIPSNRPLILPIDFVYYNNDQCVDKLVVIYNRLLRILDADKNAYDNDYKNYPLMPVEWMPSSLRAVLFNQGRFYLFTTANRLLIEKQPRSGNCYQQLVSWKFNEDEYIPAYGSQLIYQFEDLFSNKSRPAISPYDGRRSILKSGDGFKYDPPIDPMQIDDNLMPKFVLIPPSKSNFPTLIVVSVVIILVIVLDALFYFIYLSYIYSKKSGMSKMSLLPTKRSSLNLNKSRLRAKSASKSPQSYKSRGIQG